MKNYWQRFRCWLGFHYWIEYEIEDTLYPQTWRYCERKYFCQASHQRLLVVGSPGVGIEETWIDEEDW